jgi:hypothetical protein
MRAHVNTWRVAICLDDLPLCAARKPGGDIRASKSFKNILKIILPSSGIFLSPRLKRRSTSYPKIRRWSTNQRRNHD